VTADDENRRVAIVGGLVFDGTGTGGDVRDIYLTGDTITDVTPHGAIRGTPAIIDATGLAVTPGFIDVHSHADCAPLFREHDTSKILQGVTTEVVGNCGFSLAPRHDDTAAALAAYVGRVFPSVPWAWRTTAELLACIDDAGSVTNYVPLVGHGSIRIAVMGMDRREPSSAELAQMTSLLRQALDAGCFGLSSGLIYPPGMYATSQELLALASALPADRIYASHIRGEGDDVSQSVMEAIAVSESAGRRVQVSHLKVAGRGNWGRSAELLRLLDTARARGVDISQDAYPYTAASTMLAALLPPGMLDADDAEVLRRLADPAAVSTLAAAFTDGVPGWQNQVADCGWEGILVSATADHRYEGYTIAGLAGEMGTDPVRALVRVLLDERLQASMITFSMNESDVRAILASSSTMIGSDGLPPGMGGRPHPRLYGTFPRFLGKHIREEKLMPLAEAVRRMTHLPATTFGIPGRGLIAAGHIADIVAFEIETVGHDGDYLNPFCPPAGISWVMQSGRTVVRESQFCGVRRGRRLLPRPREGGTDPANGPAEDPLKHAEGMSKS